MVLSLGVAPSRDSTVTGLHSCMAVRGMIWKNTNRHVFEKGGQGG